MRGRTMPAYKKPGFTKCISLYLHYLTGRLKTNTTGSHDQYSGRRHVHCGGRGRVFFFLNGYLDLLIVVLQVKKNTW